MVLLAAGTAWRRSTVHVLKPLSPENVYLRLDLGIAAFFSLLILKLMLFGRFDVTISYPDLKYLFFPFFLFGLLTIGLMLSDGTGNRQYASGFGRMGIALSFGAVMVSGGLGMVVLFHSQMTASAEVPLPHSQKGGTTPGRRRQMPHRMAFGLQSEMMRSRCRPPPTVRNPMPNLPKGPRKPDGSQASSNGGQRPCSC